MPVAHRDLPILNVTWEPPVTPALPPTSEGFVQFAARAARTLPATAYDAIVGLGDDRSGVGAIVLRGLPVGDLGATPEHPSASTTKDNVSELTLLTAARLLGQPVGYLPEHGGDLVQNILPTSGDATRQTSTSSRVELAFHTETAFHPHRPRYLVLLCLRGDAAAATTLCSIDDIVGELSDHHRSLLRQQRFHTRADESFGGGADTRFLPPMRVLSGDDDHPDLTFDAELTTGIDEEAQAAVHALTGLIAAHHTSVVLEAGDLLVIDNRRCVHGRSPFPARFDGTDRWLQRAFVVADLAPSADERVGRIITTTF